MSEFSLISTENQLIEIMESEYSICPSEFVYKPATDNLKLVIKLYFRKSSNVLMSYSELCEKVHF